MRIDELKRIAKENDYTIRLDNELREYKLIRKIDKDNIVVNFMIIGTDIKDRLFINTIYSDEKDFNMIKASIRFAETPIGDRGNYED